MKALYHRKISRVTLALAVAGWLLAAGAYAKERRSVALVVSTTGGDTPNWAKTLVLETLYPYLLPGGQIHVVDPDLTFQIPAPAQLGERLQPKELRSLRRLLRSDYLIAGIVTGTTAKVKVEVALYQLPKGRRIAEFSPREGSPSRIRQRLTALGTEIRVELKLDELSEVELQQAKAAFPEGKAGKSYAQGLSLLRSYRSHEAIKELEKARSDCEELSCKDHPLISSALATAYFEQGKMDAAHDAASTAAKAAKTQTPIFTESLSAAAFELVENWHAARDIHRTLWEKHFDDALRGRYLAEVLIQIGEIDRARQVLKRLEGVSKTRISDGYIALAKAEAANFAGEHWIARNAAASAFRHGARVSRVLGQSTCIQQLCADAEFLKFRIFRHLGKAKRASKARSDAADQYKKANNKAGAWNAFGGYISELVLAGNCEKAEEDFMQLEDSAFHQDQGRSWIVEIQLASGRCSHDWHERASQRLLPILEAAEASNRMDIAALAKLNLGIAEHDKGNLKAAKRLFQEARKDLGSAGRSQELALALNYLAEIHFFALELDTVRDLSQQAFEINKKWHSVDGLAWDRYRLGEADRRECYWEDAVRSYRGILNPGEGFEEEKASPDIRAYARLGLARVEMARGKIEDALLLVNKAIHEIVESAEFCDEMEQKLSPEDRKILRCADPAVVHARLVEAEARLIRQQVPRDLEVTRQIGAATKRYVEDWHAPKELELLARLLQARLVTLDEGPTAADKILGEIEEAGNQGYAIFAEDPKCLRSSS